MDVREELEAVLNRPIRSPADAEVAAAAAEALAAYLRGEEAALRVLGGGSPEVPRSGDLAGLTLHAAAERVLEEAGTPLHVTELGRRIKAGGWRHPRAKPRPDQINYQLAARLPRYPQFVRTAPNTFGLARWASEPPKAASRPRLGIFSGPGGAIGRSIGDAADLPAASGEWRS
jgi:hypothetical protein